MLHKESEIISQNEFWAKIVFSEQKTGKFNEILRMKKIFL